LITIQDLYRINFYKICSYESNNLYRLFFYKISTQFLYFFAGHAEEIHTKKKRARDELPRRVQVPSKGSWCGPHRSRAAGPNPTHPPKSPLLPPSPPSSPPLRPPPQTLASPARERESLLRNGSHGAARPASGRRDQTRPSPSSQSAAAASSRPLRPAQIPKTLSPGAVGFRPRIPAGARPPRHGAHQQLQHGAALAEAPRARPTYARPPIYPGFFLFFFSRAQFCTRVCPTSSRSYSGADCLFSISSWGFFSFSPRLVVFTTDICRIYTNSLSFAKKREFILFPGFQLTRLDYSSHVHCFPSG
jgi:hypothetical protein